MKSGYLRMCLCHPNHADHCVWLRQMQMRHHILIWDCSIRKVIWPRWCMGLRGCVTAARNGFRRATWGGICTGRRCHWRTIKSLYPQPCRHRLSPWGIALGGPVTPQLRVKQTERLDADASIMPQVTSANTNTFDDDRMKGAELLKRLHGITQNRPF